MFLGLFLACQGNSQKIADDQSAKVDSLFSYLNRIDSPGVAIGVIQDGEFIYKRFLGYSNLTYGIPITNQTVFNIGSVTKQFTAACLQLLIQRGKVKLTDNINKHVPNFRQYDIPITVEHLLYHTSGLRDYTELILLGGKRLIEGYNNKEALEMILRQQQLNFPTGDRWSHSNANYVLLKEIIEQVSGTSLEVFAQENIFNPLEMNTTLYCGDHGKTIQNRATRYALLEDGRYERIPNNDMAIGDGGVFSNLDDLLLWDQNFYESNIGENGFIDSMLEIGPNTDIGGDWQLYYASGLYIGNYKGLPMVLHAGGDAGLRAVLLRFPERRFSVICLANTNEFDWTQAFQIADIYLSEYYVDQPESKSGDEPKQTAKQTKIDPRQEELTQYAGYYYSQEVDHFIRIFIEDGELKMPDTNTDSILPVNMLAKDYLKFRFGTASFQRNKKGEIVGFSLDIDGERVLGLKYHKRSE